MPISVRCYSCQETFETPDRSAGKEIRCPTCGTMLVVLKMPTASQGGAEATHEGHEKTVADDSPDRPPLDSFCPYCRELIAFGARKCKHCGEFLDPTLRPHRSPVTAVRSGPGEEKLILPALLLAFCLGPLGAHRFYTGQTSSGVTMLVLTLTGIGVLVTLPWWIIDMITLVMGSYRDGEGNRLIHWL